MSTQNKLADDIARQALPTVQSMGFDLADTELVKEGANWYLRFFIEHLASDDPVNLDDCQQVSESLSKWLDETDPVPYAYFLEVSSPGIERPLKKEKDFLRFRGHMVQVGAFAPIGGKKRLVGLLGAVDDKELILQMEGQEIQIPRDKISSVRLFWDEKMEG